MVADGWCNGANCCFNSVPNRSVFDCLTICSGWGVTLSKASVAHIRDARSNGNLVAHIKVGANYNKLKEGISHTSWNLFNDFAVCNIKGDQAVTYEMNWKVPCILYYVRKNVNSYPVHPVGEQPLQKLSQAITNDVSLAKMAPYQARRIPRARFSPLFLQMGSMRVFSVASCFTKCAL